MDIWEAVEWLKSQMSNPQMSKAYTRDQNTNVYRRQAGNINEQFKMDVRQ